MSKITNDRLGTGCFIHMTTVCVKGLIGYINIINIKDLVQTCMFKSGSGCGGAVFRCHVSDLPCCCCS